MLVVPTLPSSAQVSPSASDIAAYEGLHKAAHQGNGAEITRLIAAGADIEAVDNSKRTPLHVAIYASHAEVARALAKAGANPNAYEYQDYDIVTIAAVANNLEMLNVALEIGGKPGNITSPYIGNAVIAAAHLGHVEVVQRLIDAGTPLDHINNLNWTALMEAVVLGDGGASHIKVVQALVKAGADKSIADRDGITPLQHARKRGYNEIVAVLEGD